MQQKFYVYRIINNINSKIYIGSTINPSQRWIKHQSCANSNLREGKYIYPLYCAMRKYGIENFTFEIIKELDTCEEMLKYEIECIIEYNTLHKNGFGYNQLLECGKPGTFKSKPVAQIDFNTFEIVNTFKSTADASRFLINKDESHISCCAGGNTERKIIHGFIWRFIDEDGEIIDNGIPLEKQYFENTKYVNNSISYTIYQIRGFDNKILNTFSSIAQAYKNATDANCISSTKASIQLDTRSFKGYYYCTDINNLQLMKKKTVESKQHLPIYQLDQNKNIVNVYCSSNDAATKSGFCNSSITRATNKNKLYKDYYWYNDNTNYNDIL